MLSREEILEVLSEYDLKDLSIATLGSHTALHILKGAKEEGLRSVVVCEEGRTTPYERLGVADEIIVVESFQDMLDEEVQERLRELNAIVVPHGSFVAYVGLDGIENEFCVPIFGNRRLLRWESERYLERKLLERAGVKVPKVFDSPEDIDRPVIVKFPGARGGRGYFICSDSEEFEEKAERLIEDGVIDEEDLEQAHIEEYVVGTNFCVHYFRSVVEDTVEVLGMDRRYETNIDGLVRMPASDQLESGLEPSYVISGNIPVVVRESLLVQLYEMGDRVVRASEDIEEPGFIGPFCLQTLCTENLEFYVFELSARIDGGTNVTFLPYAYLKFGEIVTMGRRIAKEVREARDKGLLEDVVT
ncbi:formate--phosphoribosylaminoimidazolecarboxamide ligase [Methanopyrus sp. KOL6]|uniref:formate--phosphoribosylaminoimidazolecarboxamide ligase n=1 Tax=Methanopyrus sp. KOL6 TaxID=1937004 RepID=UPI000B4AE36D|nr:formate--phosphoribosylaminoimidazolecarboxamide ligase [Methanopyrus sp. KOL6]